MVSITFAKSSQIIKYKSTTQATSFQGNNYNHSRKSNYKLALLPENGVCVRCQSNLPLNLARPMCYSWFNTWRQFDSPIYPENYCYICSKNEGISMGNPVCYGCYKKHEPEIQEKNGAAKM